MTYSTRIYTSYIYMLMQSHVPYDDAERCIGKRDKCFEDWLAR